MEFFRLEGKRALVCGASQGIGAAIAQLFAEAGATVILLARDSAKLEAVKARLKGSGHEILPCDLSKAAELDATLKKIAGLRIDILVNNTSGPKGGALTDAAASEFVGAFEMHLLASHKLVQTVLPHMKQNNFGRVINILSTSVKAPIANLGVSNTIRGAVAQWSKTLAGEVGRYNITVNNILPGYTRTDRFDQLRKLSSEKMKIEESAVEKQWEALIPLGRIGEPREIASAALFLASSAGGYVSGINLPVDGGRTPGL